MISFPTRPERICARRLLQISREGLRLVFGALDIETRPNYGEPTHVLPTQVESVPFLCKNPSEPDSHSHAVFGFLCCDAAATICSMISRLGAASIWRRWSSFRYRFVPQLRLQFFQRLGAVGHFRERFRSTRRVIFPFFPNRKLRLPEFTRVIFQSAVVQSLVVMIFTKSTR